MEELKAFAGAFTCPKCSSKFKATLAEFDKENIVKCPKCKFGLQLSQSDIDQVKRDIQKLKNSFKRMSR